MQTIILILLTLTLKLSAYSFPVNDSAVSIELRPKHCLPGDVVKLHAEMKRSDFAEFALTVPTHPSIILVAKEHTPVTFKDGFYYQTSTWVLQPTEAGEFKLEGIKIFLTQEKITIEHAPSAPVLSVQSHNIIEDSNTPETLHPSSKNVSPTPLGLPLALLLLGIIFITSVLFYLKRSKPKNTDIKSSSKASLVTIYQALETNQSDTKDIEKILIDDDANLSSEIRQALEQRAYSSSSDDTKLLRIIREEINK